MQITNNHHILLAHGAGGTAMRKMIEEVIVAPLGNDTLNKLGDGARLTLPGQSLVFTTDSFVVQPPIFPGGDLGKLSVCGTINDLAVMGAQPKFLSLSLILEEGLPLELLRRLVHSVAETAQAAGVQIVTGDTKVVPHGQCDQIYVNTSGIGAYPMGLGLCSGAIVPGDALLVSGPIGDHAIAVLISRSDMPFETQVQSDCAPLGEMIGSVLKQHATVKWMRDPTRGGLAAALSELASGLSFGLLVEEPMIPVHASVKTVCELLGYDPVHLACEGRVLMVVEESGAEETLDTLRAHPLGRGAECIGRVTEEGAGIVRVLTESGGVRRLHRPAGELLPRIC
jgi:hydrogenase expression/formation protein HypE